MEVEQRELYYTDEFLPKLTERLVLIVKCINEKTEIPEQDMPVLEEVHRLWFNGTFGWMKSTLPEVPQETVQGGLFDTAVAETAVIPDNFDDARDKILDGKDVDKYIPEPLKEE